MKKQLIFSLTVILFLLSYYSYAQEDKGSPVPDTSYTWHHLDMEKDGVTGISLKEAIAFAEAKNRKPQPIVVAVLDSGIDTAHYDLKDRLWTNPGEIPGNGIDDDNNGYIDDVHGWNFLGNANGKNIDVENWEVTRLYRDLKPRFDGKKKKDIAKDELEDYKLWLKVQDDLRKSLTSNKNNYGEYKLYYRIYKDAYKTVYEYMDKDKAFTIANLSELEALDDSDLGKARNLCIEFLKMGVTVEEMKEYADHFETIVKQKLNVNYDVRHIVGDDVANINDSIYGNNDIQGGDASHGTHVAGIIGADCNNELGTKGVCPTSELMILRIVPSGDERDKDVAMAYRYAAKMGAKIVNCSFGKTYSPHKEMVDDAIRFSDQKGVLIVHASGNDALNNDKVVHYPVKHYDGKESGSAQNWITVGSNTLHTDKRMISDFSNYGVEEVDLFAPGSDILSTYPLSKLKKQNGTSMATPVVSGVAALVWSYYPELTVEQLKEILLKSIVDFSDFKVIKPNEEGKSRKTKVGKLCATGGVVNALKAMQMADSYVNK